jgi:putative hydrolase of the HAD superfamily
MNKDQITHVFFDLDHTLWDFDRNSALTFEKIFSSRNINLTLNEFLAVYEPVNLKYWKLYREAKIHKDDLRYGRLKDVFDILKFDISDQDIFGISDDYIKYLTSFTHLFDGTIEILEYLYGKYDLHIITNGFEEVQQGKMDHSNISHFFKTVTNSEMVGVKKPDPKIFYFALDLANATPENSVMIGDNYEADILGALSIGMEALCFNYHKEELKPHIKVIENLNAIKNYL